MKANELSIGNWVQDRNGFRMYIRAVYDDDTVDLDFFGNEADVWEEDIKDIKPILITPDIISCTYFKYFKGGRMFPNYRMEMEDIVIHLSKVDSRKFIVQSYRKNTNMPLIWKVEVHYLHELQNVFKLITGKELEVDL